MDKQVEQNESLKQPTEVNIKELNPSQRYEDIFTEFIPDKANRIEHEGSEVLIRCANGIHLKINVCRSNIFRLRYAPKGRFRRDFSYAIDPEFQTHQVPISVEEDKKEFRVKTADLTCAVRKNGMLVEFRQSDGTVINSDHKGFYGKSTIMKGWTDLAISKKAEEGESFFGLGDKASSLNLRGGTFKNWNSDSFAYGRMTDPLYRAIPFYYGLTRGIGYGIFLDNTFETRFDFDSKKNGEVRFAAEGGELNYYFIYGPDLSRVAEDYVQLTGRPELPPMWALGFHQCRWSYFPDARVREVADDFRKHKIPCDAIYLDIDYMDGYRCFTWNKKRFPSPKKMIADLREQGFRTVVMIDPGLRIDPDYEVYKDGLDKDVFCRRSNGDLMTGPVWPPDCVWPEYTDPAVRKWWGPLYKKLYVDQGVSGFWNDMNEPAIFGVKNLTFPDQVRHQFDGDPCSHQQAHNIYGLAMTMASYDGLKNLQPNVRPFLLTRASYAGGQRYAAVWTGDNVATWEHLRIANRQCQRLSISGFSFNGSDIGGFVNLPTGELMVRWLQLAIFHPFYRIHSMGNNSDGAAEVNEADVLKREKIDRMDQEPWAFGEKFTRYNRQAIELRYQLLPYIYTAFKEHIETGSPMIRSMIFYDQKDPMHRDRQREFVFGQHLMVSPVTKPRRRRQKAYLPVGQWFDYWTGESLTGGQKVEVAAPLQQIPMFVNAGAVIPHYPVRQHTAKPVKQLILKAYFKIGETNSRLYEDAGEGYDYQNGQYADQQLTLVGSPKKVVLRRKTDGSFELPYKNCRLEFYGLRFTPTIAIVDGKEVVVATLEKNKWVMTVPKNFKKVELRVKAVVEK